MNGFRIACKVDGCASDAKAKGACMRHYKRYWKNGTYEPLIADVLTRVMARVVEGPAGCWLWQGVTTSGGYGGVIDRGRYRMVHRVVYEAHKGTIPDGMQLDHLCRIRNCVNPKHLEPVTPAENMRRSASPIVAAVRQLSKTHCINGHEYNEENTRVVVRKDREGRTSRYCRACRRGRYAAKKQAAP